MIPSYRFTYIIKRNTSCVCSDNSRYQCVSHTPSTWTTLMFLFSFFLFFILWKYLFDVVALWQLYPHTRIPNISLFCRPFFFFFLWCLHNSSICHFIEFLSLTHQLIYNQWLTNNLLCEIKIKACSTVCLSATRFLFRRLLIWHSVDFRHFTACKAHYSNLLAEWKCALDISYFSFG